MDTIIQSPPEILAPLRKIRHKSSIYYLLQKTGFKIISTLTIDILERKNIYDILSDSWRSKTLSHLC